MMVTLFNSLSELNEFKDEATYRLTGNVEMNSGPPLSLSTMQASGEMPMPAPMVLAGWWGDKFNRLYLNAVNPPSVKRVSVTVDLLPERRVASIETPGWRTRKHGRAIAWRSRSFCGPIAATASSAISPSRFPKASRRASTRSCSATSVPRHRPCSGHRVAVLSPASPARLSDAAWPVLSTATCAVVNDATCAEVSPGIAPDASAPI